MKTLMMMTILAIMAATMVKSEEVKKDVVTEKVTETATVIRVWLEKEWIDIKVEELCGQISQKIQGITTEIVSGVVNSTYEELQPVLQQGAEQVYITRQRKR